MLLPLGKINFQGQSFLFRGWGRSFFLLQWQPLLQMCKGNFLGQGLQKGKGGRGFKKLLGTRRAMSRGNWSAFFNFVRSHPLILRSRDSSSTELVRSHLVCTVLLRKKAAQFALPRHNDFMGAHFARPSKFLTTGIF